MDESRRPFAYAALAGLATLIACGLWGYATLPERIATSFDFAGQPVAWGSKATILILPLVGSALVGLTWATARFSLRPNLPFAVRPERMPLILALNKEMVAALSLVLIAGFIAMEFELVAAARASAMPAAFLPTTGALVLATFACIGAYVARMYRAA